MSSRWPLVLNQLPTCWSFGRVISALICFLRILMCSTFSAHNFHLLVFFVSLFLSRNTYGILFWHCLISVSESLLQAQRQWQQRERMSLDRVREYLKKNGPAAEPSDQAIQLMVVVEEMHHLVF